MTEIFRAGLIALAKGQYEAAFSQGMTRFQTFRYVMFPQILRTIYAPLGNHCIGVVHASSLASIISVIEVTAWAENTGASSFRFFETFTVAALVYVCTCQAINISRIQLGRYLFRRQSSSARFAARSQSLAERSQGVA